MSSIIPALTCCCGDPPEREFPTAMTIVAHLGLINANGSWQKWSDPTHPSFFPGGEEETWPTPSCNVEAGELACTLACGVSDTRPAPTQITCPDGVSLDAPRPWGSGHLVTYTGAEYYFRDDPVVLPLGDIDVEFGGCTYNATPPGGGASVAIGAGSTVRDLVTYYGEPWQLVPVEDEIGCVQQISGISASILEPVLATWRGRKKWVVPPAAMQLSAPAMGWTVEIAAGTMTVTSPAPATHTQDLTLVNFDGLRSWLVGLGLTVLDGTGGAWSSEPIGPFSPTMLADITPTPLPTGAAAPLTLRIFASGDSIVMSGDDDHDPEPSWTVSIHDHTGTPKRSITLGWHRFGGTELQFLWGFAVDYAADDYVETVTIALVDWGYFSMFMNVLPIPGLDYVGAPLVLVPASAATTTQVCWQNDTNVNEPQWDQDPGDCWVACHASATRTIQGGLALWQMAGS